MKLVVFLSEYAEQILAEWDKFAKEKMPPESDMSPSALRGHAAELLAAIGQDIESVQSSKQQYIKSKGEKTESSRLDAVAVSHGMARQNSGFNLVDVASEYRALRASVLRLWVLQVKEMTEDFTEDMLRFNEAIDQALSQSIKAFSEQTAITRDTFLAVLGHDLRNPLHVITLTGAIINQMKDAPPSIHKAGMRIVTSSARMSLMVNDLLEYGRTQLGGKLVIKRHVVDMGRICEDITQEARDAHPDHEFVLHQSGNLIGSFDEARLQQVFANLLDNAAHYSVCDKSIDMFVQGNTDAIAIKVHNVGPIIPSKSLQSIFEPLVQLSKSKVQTEICRHSAGLGLYIARELTQAHGGSIRAESSPEIGTIFSVLLPRSAGNRKPGHVA